MSRVTRVFERGNWMILGDKVFPKIPNVLNSKNIDGSQTLTLRICREWQWTDQKPLLSRSAGKSSLEASYLEEVWWHLLRERWSLAVYRQIPPTSILKLLDYLALATMHDNMYWSVKVTNQRKRNLKNLLAQASREFPHLYHTDRKPKFGTHMDP